MSSSSSDEPEAKRSRPDGGGFSKGFGTLSLAPGAVVTPGQGGSPSDPSLATYNRLAAAAAARLQDLPRPRVYVGNLDLWVSEQEIMQIFSSFGVVTGIDMPRDGIPPQSKGFCFVEFVEQKMADRAIAALQDFMLGGRKLRVGQPTMQRRVTSAPAPPISMLSVSGGAGGAPAPRSMPPLAPGLAGGGASPPGSSLPTSSVAAAPAARPMPSATATGESKPAPDFVQVLLLENLVPAGAADEDLAEEVREECGRFGAVKKVRVHEFGKERNVRVFVEFKDAAGGAKAAAKMNGRWFGKRKVRAVAYDKEAFVAGDLDRGSP